MDTPDEIIKFYREMLEKHGPTPEGMGWKDAETHFKRVKQAEEFARVKYAESSILDVGCGIGLVADSWGNYRRYVGIDLVPEYITIANERWSSDLDVEFKVADFLTSHPEGNEEFDITLMLGTLAWQPATTAVNMLNKLWTYTKRVMIFTALIDRPFPVMQLVRINKYLNLQSKGIRFTYHTGYTDTPEAMIVMERNQ